MSRLLTLLRISTVTTIAWVIVWHAVPHDDGAVLLGTGFTASFCLLAAYKKLCDWYWTDGRAALSDEIERLRAERGK